jgi:hypothetical protein
LFSRDVPVDALANRATTLPAVPLDGLFAANPMLLVRLSLIDARGASVSDNFYWRGRDEAAYRALNDLAPVTLAATVDAGSREGEDRVLRVTLGNDTEVPALNAKLTLVDGQGRRILPAYYDDNYVSLLPGERREITIRYPAVVTGEPKVTLRGWNVPAAIVQRR